MGSSICGLVREWHAAESVGVCIFNTYFVLYVIEICVSMCEICEYSFSNAIRVHGT